METGISYTVLRRQSGGRSNKDMKKKQDIEIIRYMDCFLTVIIFLLIWPLFLAICVAIKLDSKGPVFFKQKRVGYRKT